MYIFKKFLNKLRTIKRYLYFQYIEMINYPKIREIKNFKIKNRLNDGKLLIILRGETFRDNYRLDVDSKVANLSPQIECVKSLIKHVILEIKKNKPQLEIEVKLVVYPNINNKKLVNLISKYAKCSLEEINKLDNNQVSTFINCMKRGIESRCDAILIIRIDLNFISNLCIDQFSRNKVLFQWNLLHNKHTMEVPDQLHFIGSVPLKKLYQKSFCDNKELNILKNDLNELRQLSTCRLDIRWPGTLHNFLRFCILNMEITNIGYMNYVKDPDINKVDCDVRGHPNSRNGNPLYTF